MGYYSGTFFSKALEFDTALGVILPQDSRKHNGVEALKEGIIPSEKPKTLILLHGLGDNYLTWFSRTSILRYAEEYDIAVLMPEVTRSFYTNMAYGRNYFEYITEELPEYAAKVFNISTAPEDLMIAGLSMGGFGALKCGLTYPEEYMGVGVFSSAWNIKELILDGKLGTDSFDQDEINKDRIAIFGKELKMPEHEDILKLIEKAQSKKKTPKFFMTIGTDDFLYESNQVLRKAFEKTNLDFSYEEMPGIHEWAVWDKSVQMLLDKFLLGK
jgi:S-formylglutathione hydrolase FrmB